MIQSVLDFRSGEQNKNLVELSRPPITAVVLGHVTTLDKASEESYRRVKYSLPRIRGAPPNGT